MISNINNNLYIQSSDVKRSGDIAKVEGSQNIDGTNSRVAEIKKELEAGTYQLMTPNILAKVFVENELGL